MSSYQITISPSKRAAGRFISRVRRSIQKALAEEQQKSGITQSDVAREIGVNRSVISREIRGHKDITLGRVGELAWALGRRPQFDLVEQAPSIGANYPTETPGPINRPLIQQIPNSSVSAGGGIDSVITTIAA